MDHKSFYFTVPWDEVHYLKETLSTMEMPFAIEQKDAIVLEEGQVAFVFPPVSARHYQHLRELFGEEGKLYPEETSST
ncbi:UNVERIFIED_CONTAM: hypothetical protein ABID98_001384 [Brevibacillus sp. OAP136]